MFNRRTLATALAATALVFTTSAFAQYAERTIKFTNGVNEDHPVGVGVKRMQEVLNARTGGKIKISAFWGAMMSSGTAQIFLAPWTILGPGLAIAIAVVSINLFGDALIEALDIRNRVRDL